MACHLSWCGVLVIRAMMLHKVVSAAAAVRPKENAGVSSLHLVPERTALDAW